MTITLSLAPEVVKSLEATASQNGKSLEAYIQELAEREAQRGRGTDIPKMSEVPPAFRMAADEWEKELRAWAAGHPTLPTIADDSRESIYEGRGE